MSSEGRRVEILRACFERRCDPAVQVGIGDDAAVMRDGSVVSVDAAVEDVHFRRSWIGRGASWKRIAHRAARAALSDLFAMGAEPTAMVTAWTLPPRFRDDELEELAAGFESAADESGILVVGGNLSSGSSVSLTTTVLGRGTRPLLRKGAQVGDSIWLSGHLGSSALALLALEGQRGDDPEFAPVIDAYFARPLRRDAARLASATAHAAIDVSDGLAIDLMRLCEASAVGAVIDASSLPITDFSLHAARRLGVTIDPWRSGEEYELLFAAPADVDLSSVAHRIGAFVEGGDLVVRDAHGERLLEAAGFDHFAVDGL